jgi:hypothetical protein
MPVYWCFRLDEMKETVTCDDIDRVIDRFRRSCDKIRPRQDIPV